MWKLGLCGLLFLSVTALPEEAVVETKVSKPSIVADWYEVRTIAPNIYWVNEPFHVSFYVLKNGSEALFIDSGLGLSDQNSKALLKHLGVETFDVLVTHAHCDHIGMNYLARNVYVGKDEWEKYVKVDDRKQLASYRIMEKEKRWPKKIDTPLETRPWKPTAFLNDGETRNFGAWKLGVVSVPGHTMDSLCFFEKSLAYLFCGDVIYTGALYLHLPDSSLSRYHETLVRLHRLMDKKGKEILLWPAHNRIPVHKGYLSETIQLVEDIEKGTATPTGSGKADAIFTDSVEFQKDKVKIIIQKGEWDAIGKKKGK